MELLLDLVNLLFELLFELVYNPSLLEVGCDPQLTNLVIAGGILVTARGELIELALFEAVELLVLPRDGVLNLF